MCGAGIQGGAVYGASDAKGASPDVDSVGVEDFNATIAKAMGLPLDKEFFCPNADHSEFVIRAAPSKSC